MRRIFRKVWNYISDYFVCENCDYGMYVKVRGDTYKCPECGGTMRRT